MNNSLIAAPPAAERAFDFARVARALMLARGASPISAAKAAALNSETFADPPEVRRILQKGAAGTIDGSGLGAQPEYAIVASSFEAKLRHAGIFDRALASGLRLPLRAVGYRAISIVGAETEELAVKVPSSLSFEAAALDVKKCTSHVILSQELIRLGGDAMLDVIDRELTAAVAAGTDAIFLAGLTTAGGTGGSAGSTAANIATDFDTALSALSTGARSRVIAAVSPTAAKGLALKATTTGALAFPGLTINGGAIGGIEVMPSDALTDTAIIFDAGALALAADPVILSSGSEATLDLAGGATPTFNVWTQNCAAIRAERFFAFAPLANDTGSGAAPVAYTLTGVAW